MSGFLDSAFCDGADGSRVAYHTLGAARAPWITLLNGYTRAWTDFRSMAKQWVERGFSVLALDNRGAGQTTVAGPFTLDDMAGDVVRVWDATGISSSALLGISMGGVIAQRLAAQQAARVERLVLVSTCPHHRHMRSTVDAWAATVPEIIEQLKTYVAEDFLAKNRLLVEAMAKTIAQNAGDPRFHAGARLQRQALAGFDHTELARGLTVPTRIIHGEVDRVIPCEAGEELQRLIGGSQLEKLPGKGHLLLAEAPQALLESAWRFASGAKE